MLLYIHKRLLGTKSHLEYDGDIFRWSLENIENYEKAWWAGHPNALRDIHWLATATKTGLTTFPSVEYIKAWECLLPADTPVCWIHALPADVFKEQLLDYLEQLWSFLKTQDDSYYVSTLLEHRELIQSLESSKINEGFLKDLIEKNPQHQSTLQRYQPDELGYCKKPSYDLTSSSTGRLVISKGPNILTLNKTFRGIFKSSYKNGRLIQIDLKTLEPRIAIYLSQDQEMIIDDIYSDLIIRQLGIDVSRSDAKKIVISAIYGMSHKTLSNLLPGTQSSKLILENIKQVFGLDQLHKKISSEISKKGFFNNLYGRKLKNSNALVNHYLQSTGVDVALTVFSEIINQLNKKNARFKPLFIIHDALVLDISIDSYDYVEDVCREGFDIKPFKSKFPVKISDFI